VNDRKLDTEPFTKEASRKTACPSQCNERKNRMNSSNSGVLPKEAVRCAIYARILHALNPAKSPPQRSK
jgi:hypothetical protein